MWIVNLYYLLRIVVSLYLVHLNILNIKLFYLKVDEKSKYVNCLWQKIKLMKPIITSSEYEEFWN